MKSTTQGMVETVGRGILIAFVLGSMFLFGNYADPGAKYSFVDRVLTWTFVVFAVGSAELFVLLVILSIMGRLDIADAFRDKIGTDAGKSPAVSLSRLQAFLWTLLVMIVFFHRVVKNGSENLPTIPVELLMVMGISSAVYLTSKEMNRKAAEQAQVTERSAPGGDAPARVTPKVVAAVATGSTAPPASGKGG
ncbi:MAG TPA: hypothetical protein VFP10_07375 [Candidatus Eisenbacteria bacterium]|nr:hypothetical protein [Candidatus Eisenbacteria bacterium]